MLKSAAAADPRPPSPDAESLSDPEGTEDVSGTEVEDFFMPMMRAAKSSLPPPSGNCFKDIRFLVKCSSDLGIIHCTLKDDSYKSVAPVKKKNIRNMILSFHILYKKAVETQIKMIWSMEELKFVRSHRNLKVDSLVYFVV